jgi:cytochrome P450
VTAGQLPVVDLRDPAFWRDIHAPLRAARTIHPIAVMPSGERLALGYDEVRFVLRDPRFRSTDLLARSGVRSGRLHEWWSTVMFSTDPPVHTRLRRLVSRAFTPRAVDDMRPLIRDIADGLLDRVVEQGHMDVLHDFAHHLPIKVIGTMLGVPEGDYPTFASWTTTLGRAFSPVIDDALRQQLEQAICGLDDYVDRLIDERRRRPGDDLLSQLIAAEEDGDRLSVDELIAMVENLLFAGHDTTRGLLSIALPLLCDHPEQLDRVRSHQQLMAAAVEEILRYEPPVMGGAREAAERIEIAAGVTVDEGERVSISVAAANRDPRAFDDPDSFDIGRTDKSKLASFGQGIHYCLGAALARTEAEVALRRLLDRCRSIEVTAALEWVPFAPIRHYRSVPISFTPAPRRIV